MKINWKDPRFEGLSKRQIKDFCIGEAAGKKPKLPKPQATKRVNKKIKKQEFLKTIKDPAHPKKNEKKGQLNSMHLPLNCISQKRLRVMELSNQSPTVLIDSSFEDQHNKKVCS